MTGCLLGLTYDTSLTLGHCKCPADSFAVKHKMESYILKTKDFILNNADISEVYKKRIKRYYLSPEEIMVLVEERNNLTTV